jgi:hypothetical protein
VNSEPIPLMSSNIAAGGRGGVFCGQQHVALGLRRPDLLEEQLKPIKLAANLRLQSAALQAARAGYGRGRQRPAVGKSFPCPLFVMSRSTLPSVSAHSAHSAHSKDSVAPVCPARVLPLRSRSAQTTRENDFRSGIHARNSGDLRLARRAYAVRDFGEAKSPDPEQ